ncbi:MAG: hypothetical protein CBD16_07690 [Betaproteobacteria bacterium TMED156]|nr:MAG: hypothetical protein CBD16_07690 [Betaproteobacteria bacterium TMED156]
MADGDKITIDQINWDDSNLPKWATEATQEKIAKHLGAMKKTDDKEEKENKKQTKALQDVVKRVEQLNKNSSDSSKKLVASLNKKGGDYTKDLVKKNISTPFKSVNMAVQKFAGKLGIVGAAFGALAAGIGFVIGRLKQFSDSFRQVFAMGFRFEQGSLGLAQAAVAAEMGINQYTELLGKFSTSVGIIGAKAFSDLNVQIRDNLQAQGMLGMSLAELTEYTADFMDQLRTASMLGGKSNDELEEMVVRYTQNITAFSQLANVSRDQIAAIIKSSTAVESFTNRLNLLPEVVQARVLQASQTVAGMFAGLGTEFGDQLATTFTTAYGRGGLFFTEAGRELLAVNRRLYNSLSGIINNLDSLDDQGAARATSELITEIANTSEAERERLRIIERSNTQYAGAARQQIALINQIQEIQEKGALEQYKDLQKLRRESQIDKLSIAFINFERVTAKLSVAFNKFFTTLFGDDRILNAISGALDDLTDMGINLADKLLDRAESIAKGVVRMINRFMNFIDGFEGRTLGGSIAYALGGVFGLLQDAIVFAITKGLKLGLPFGGGDVKEAEEERLGMVQKGEAIRTAITTGDASALDESFIPSKTELSGYYKNKALAKAIPGYQQKMTAGMNATDADMMSKLIAKAYDDIPKKSKRQGEDFRENIIDAIKTLDDTTRNRVLTVMLDQQNAKIRSQDEKINRLIGTEGSPGATSEVVMPGTNDTMPGTNNAALTADSDPLDEAKMRIMKQYLPMVGSKDPNEDPAGDYYATSIQLLRQQVAELEKITKSSKTTADAST